MSVGSLPRDDNGMAVPGFYNDVSGLILPWHIGGTVVGADGKTYARPEIIVANGNWTQVYSTNQSGVSSWSGSGDITNLSSYKSLYVNINVSALTGTSIQFVLQRKDSFGNYIFVKQTAVITGPGSAILDVGDSLNYFGSTIKLVVNLVAITSVSFTVDVEAR